jgi:hypothetical protein
MMVSAMRGINLKTLERCFEVRDEPPVTINMTLAVAALSSMQRRGECGSWLSATFFIASFTSASLLPPCFVPKILLLAEIYFVNFTDESHCM